MLTNRVIGQEESSDFRILSERNFLEVEFWGVGQEKPLTLRLQETVGTVVW
jgi:hypothetical protein